MTLRESLSDYREELELTRVRLMRHPTGSREYDRGLVLASVIERLSILLVDSRLLVRAFPPSVSLSQ